MSRNDTTSALLALLVVTAVVAAFTGSVSAGHGAEFGNYTVNLPNEEDNYPGDQGGQASIEHFAAGTQEAFDDAGAPDGYEKMSWIVIKSNDISFANCGTSNTQAFGIDRDNDDGSTQTDVDLLRYREGGEFADNYISVNFYEGDELGAPGEPDNGGKSEGRGDGDSNAEMYPDDEIVARQADCYVMPEEPGWYQINGKLNGTNWQGEFTTVRVPSHYFYICECSSEEEARQKLGPPPSEQSGGSEDSTPTPTPAQSTPTPVSESTPTPEQSTPTPQQSTPTPEQSTPTPNQATATATDAVQQGGGGGGSNTGGNAGGGGAAAGGGGQQQQAAQAPATDRPLPDTPTIADGPGFGIGLAVLALLGAALLALRRSA